MEIEALPPHQGTIFPGSNSVHTPGTTLGSGIGRVFPCLPAACLAQAFWRRSKHSEQEAFTYQIHRGDQKTQAGTGRW